MAAESFAITPAPRRTRPGLTPMIDVIFLLLVFFMLSARFGSETAIPLSTAGEGTSSYRGAPRLVTVTPDQLLLNGTRVTPEALPAQLAPLMPDADALVVLTTRDGAHLQRLVDIIDLLNVAGIHRVVLAETPR